jgi:predicted ATPase
VMSKEVRKLINKWNSGDSWPKRLEWIEIQNIRGWTKQRIDFNFPFVAIVGENGSGKSTILQAIASVYKAPDGTKSFFASDFFPDTAWDNVFNAAIQYSVREGDKSTTGSVRKPSTRWRGNPERRIRTVNYIDLRRVQPIAAQIGYSRLAKPQFHEAQQRAFDPDKLGRLSAVMGRSYDNARHSLTNADDKRWIPVVGAGDVAYSGFHQGAGETTIIDFLRYDFPKYGIVLIDELETSLHPRSQRRLVRELAEACRIHELQIIVTTHSPYVLEELPVQARTYVMRALGGRQLVTGVSPYFAMTKMDEERHPEVDIYVEDDHSKIMMEEIIGVFNLPVLPRCEIIPYGAASVGKALGQMASQERFPRPSLVLLDADQEPYPGCMLLPGDDAPERVVFSALADSGWPDVAKTLNRSHSDLVDASAVAMTAADHHEWVKSVADKLIVGGHDLWRAMTGAWARNCMEKVDAKPIVDKLEAMLASVS